ncbi:hypothetical protein CMO92_01565 [Candidatus Woesearchaeota archaeon]|nr:hypothetical protein [Candidatus Woesearchaeota archaeon]
MDKELLIVSIVAIVAIIGMVSQVITDTTTSDSSQTVNIAGQAYNMPSEGQEDPAGFENMNEEEFLLFIGGGKT